MKITTKTEAAEAGSSRYFTGLPCKRGHVAERVLSKGDCVECLDARRKAWAAKNADQVLASSRRWYKENLEKAKATRAAWRSANKDKCKADVSAYQKANAAHLKEAARALYKANPDRGKAKTAAYREKNKDKVLDSGRNWRLRNKDKVNAKKVRRIAGLLQATPAWANEFFIGEAYHLAKIRQKVCGGSWHVDHIVPLRSNLVCGLHCEANLQVIPGRLNQAKSNTYWPDMPV